MWQKNGRENIIEQQRERGWIQAREVRRVKEKYRDNDGVGSRDVQEQRSIGSIRNIHGIPQSDASQESQNHTMTTDTLRELCIKGKETEGKDWGKRKSH